MKHVSVPTSAIERLFAQPQRYELFQAVRLLERWMTQQNGHSSSSVLNSRLRFRNSLSLAFAPSEIERFRLVATTPENHANHARLGAATATELAAVLSDEQHIEITPAFMGLLGATGTLPTFYTELFAQREAEHKDSSPRAFLDMFLHRAIVMFYQAWRKHRLPVLFEADRRQHFLPMVLSIAGLGNSALRDRLKASQGGVADDALAFYAGALQQRPLSAPMLGRVLAQYLGVKVKVEQFVGRWFNLPAAHETSLGLANAVLGRTVLAGQRVWQRDLRLRLVLYPQTREMFRRFLPGAPGSLALKELLTLFSGVTLEYEVRLLLRADQVKGIRLHGQDGSHLGWDSYLITRRSPRDRDDACYTLHGLA